MDILLTTAAITAIATLAAAGVAALPWTQREIAQTHDALDALQQARFADALATDSVTVLEMLPARAVQGAVRA